ncbi:MAG TPA: hypothetical protein VL100_11430 [Croceibacterium sp.]|nr:hypothetical protein [Croceibacterium sp.]
MLEELEASAAVRSDLLGAGLPGHKARGISLEGFLKYFPDDRACLNFLFWARGGHRLRCRLCGQPTRWIPQLTTTMFYSACCKTTLSATRGTMLHKCRLPHWYWFYTLMLTLSLSASPRVTFLARHLDVSDNTAWHILRKLREQFACICAQGSKTLRGQAVFVKTLKIKNVQTARGRHTVPVSVLAIATDRNAFAYVMPRRHPADARRILDALGVPRTLSVYDVRPRDPLLAVQGYRLEHLTAATRNDDPARWRAAANGIRLATYLRYNMSRWPVSVRRSYLQDYLAEFVLRYNFAHDKAMLFPLFMTSLDRVKYNEKAPPNPAFPRRKHVSAVLS